MKRVPMHEPWALHENFTPAFLGPKETDRETAEVAGGAAAGTPSEPAPVPASADSPNSFVEEGTDTGTEAGTDTGTEAGTDTGTSQLTEQYNIVDAKYDSLYSEVTQLNIEYQQLESDILQTIRLKQEATTAGNTRGAIELAETERKQRAQLNEKRTALEPKYIEMRSLRSEAADLKAKIAAANKGT